MFVYVGVLSDTLEAEPAVDDDGVGGLLVSYIM